MGFPIIGGIIDKAMGVIDKAIPDKDLRNQIRANMLSEFLGYEATLVEQAGQTIRAEASGESWLQRNWRPLAMLNFLGLINAYWFDLTPEKITPELAVALLDLVKIGLGGYVVGRSAEKVAKAVAPAIGNWKKKG